MRCKGKAPSLLEKQKERREMKDLLRFGFPRKRSLGIQATGRDCKKQGRGSREKGVGRSSRSGRQTDKGCTSDLVPLGLDPVGDLLRDIGIVPQTAGGQGMRPMTFTGCRAPHFTGTGCSLVIS